jgi:hypothetical protein
MVPIALSNPDSGGVAAVEVISALAGAANATAAVSGGLEGGRCDLGIA